VVSDQDDERPSGTLGGGCVEADAILTAREVMVSGERSLRAYQLSESRWNSGLVAVAQWDLSSRTPRR
jgi:xanthine/CO dehydrogenase XdhC/CoxF family maturation factor